MLLLPASVKFMKGKTMFLKIFQRRLLTDHACLILLLCVLLSSQTISPEFAVAGHLQSYTGQKTVSDAGESLSDIPELDWFGSGKVSRAHSYLSSSVESLSQRIDTFFGEERVYEEATGTYVQARGSVILEQDGAVDYDLKFRAKMRLPQLKSRFKLLIENDDEPGIVDDFARDSKGNTLADEVDNSGLSASLQYLFMETDRWNISLRPGLKLSDPIEAFLKLRMSRTKQLNKRWLSRGTVQLGYFTEEGWGNDWKLELERRAGRKDLFRSTTSVTWRRGSPGNQFLSQTLLLTRILNPRSSVAFELGMRAETRPELQDTSYFTNVRYRRDIHRGWLFFELRPRVVFARENNFDEELSLVLTLEVLLGENYAH
jgi:hypothetical protein